MITIKILKKAECAMLIALCVSLCWGIRATALQQKLSENIIRMHVIAEGNADTQQALKMKVQQAVSLCTENILSGSGDAGSAAQALEDNLESIRLAALSAAEGREISVKLGRETYPTRTTSEYSLPAGEYTSLRIIIGEGEGRNWWGIIFPQLLPGDADSAEKALEVLGQEGAKLILHDGEETVYRFRILEILQQLSEYFNKA